MKNSIKYISPFLWKTGLGICLMLSLIAGSLSAQDEASTTQPSTRKPVRDIFESVWILDNQTVMVPVKGTFEMDIQHRFGTVNNGFDDLWGIYAPGNIRLGFNYAPISKLYVGFGLTKERMTWDFNVKYALLQQMKGGGLPFSVTYFGNMAVDGRDKKFFGKSTDRLSYFHQVIIASKITSKLSVQASPSLSYFNSVEGYFDNNGDVQKKFYNAHFAVAFMARYKLTEKMALIAGVDQPFTAHPTNNPYPNVSFGLDMTTSGHSFQVFFGNYGRIIPQYNNVFNQNDYQNGYFLIGFNISRLWNF